MDAARLDLLFNACSCYYFLKFVYFYIVFEELMDELKQQIKEVIISSLQLEDVTPEDIVDSDPLFSTGLGLDSIDALELGVALKKKFGIKFSSESADNKKHFASVDALAEYISAMQVQ